MSSFAVCVDPGVGLFFKGFVVILCVQMCILLSLSVASRSLFLFCNQLLINTAVNVFRLFQSGGCTLICLIAPFCSMFWMRLMNEAVDVFCVESFFLMFKMIS